MPIYEYECDTCGRRTDMYRDMRRRNEVVRCQQAPLVGKGSCSGSMHKAISVPSPLKSTKERPGRGRG